MRFFITCVRSLEITKRIGMIEHCHKKLSVRKQAELLKVNRSRLYYKKVSERS